MGPDKIDRYIGDLEALKEYDSVCEARVEALRNVGELQKQLHEETMKVEALSDEIDEMKIKFQKKEEEVNTLTESMKENAEELMKKNVEVEERRKRIEELETAKATVDGRTLHEAELHFLESKKEEVSSKAGKLFEDMRSEWERWSKPKEVRNDAIALLKATVDNISKEGANHLAKEISDSNIHKDVTKILNDEVRKRLDEEFDRRVETVSEQYANQKLGYLKSVAWPDWYRSNIEPRIIELESAVIRNVMDVLKGSWIISCDKCGTEQSIQLTSVGIEEMFIRGKISVECTQVDCRDFFGRHRIWFDLKSLIEVKSIN